MDSLLPLWPGVSSPRPSRVEGSGYQVRPKVLGLKPGSPTCWPCSSASWHVSLPFCRGMEVRIRPLESAEDVGNPQQGHPAVRALRRGPEEGRALVWRTSAQDLSGGQLLQRGGQSGNPPAWGERAKAVLGRATKAPGRPLLSLRLSGRER